MSIALSHASIGTLLELVPLELVFSPLGISARGAGFGTVGGVLEWSVHHPKMQMTSGKGLGLRCFFLDCCFCSSAMMSSTGRSAGHEGGGADCANIPAVTTTTATAHRICTQLL